MKKISAVYKIVNTVTGDSYVGSSKDAMRRWKQHKRSSLWKYLPNSSLYRDMQKYGIENFRFQILAPVEPEYLTQVEQEFIDLLHPTYNNKNAKGKDVERRKETVRKWEHSEKGKECRQSNKYKVIYRKASKKYYSRLCFYNGETLTFSALKHRFQRAGIPHPNVEAKKYLLTQPQLNK